MTFVYFAKHFAVISCVVILALAFHSPLVKAQTETDAENLFQANFPAHDLYKAGEIVENNLADPSNITTEIGIWERDLGNDVTDGSYVGGLLQSSSFQLDYDPYMQNDTLLVEYEHTLLPDDAEWNENAFYNDYYLKNESDYGQPAGTFEDYGFREGALNIPIAKKRTVLALSSEVVFSNRAIMSGATDFWVKLPVVPSCINYEVQPTVSIFNLGVSSYDPSLISLAEEYKINYQGSPIKMLYNDTSGVPIGQVPTNIGDVIYGAGSETTLRMQYNSNEPEIFQELDGRYIFDDTAYAHIYATVEPNINYAVVFSCMLKSKPTVYFVEDDVCSNGRSSTIQYLDMEFDKYNQELNNEIDEFEWDGTVADSYVETQEYAVVRSDSSSYQIETQSIAVDLGWSFIFKQGRGNYGMFGHKFHFEPRDAFVFYKPLDEAIYDDKFISVMIPFISDDEITVNITATLLPLGAEYGDSSVESQYSADILHNRFEDKGVLSMLDETMYTNATLEVDATTSNTWLSSIELSYIKPFWWQSPTSMNYADFILFTIPQKLDAFTLTNDAYVKIMIMFEKEADLTFMFNTINPAYASTVVEDEPIMSVDVLSYYSPTPSLWKDVATSYEMRVKNTYIYSDVATRPMFFKSYDERGLIEPNAIPNLYHEAYYEMVNQPQKINDVTTLHYELFSSVQLTDGIWYEYATTLEGYPYATHYFERRIALGVVNLWVDTTNNETTDEQAWYSNDAWDKASQLWSDGKYLEAVRYGIEGAITTLWDGGSIVFGVTMGVFKKAFDGLLALGNFIKAQLMSFYGWIASIIGDIVDATEDILGQLLYTIALILFIYIVSRAGKLIYMSKAMAWRG